MSMINRTGLHRLSCPFRSFPALAAASVVALCFGAGCTRNIALRDESWGRLVDSHRHDVNVGNLSLHYIDMGNGEPVLLIHGIGDSTYSWHENVPELLAAGFRVILVDQPGFGLSSVPPRDWVYSVENQAEAVLKVADVLRIDRFDLVGHSLGGGVSLYLASKYPERTKRVVVISPVSERTGCPFGVVTDAVRWMVGTRWFVSRALRSAYFSPDKLDDVVIDEYARLLDRPGRMGRGAMGGVCRGYFSPAYDRMTQTYAELKPELLVIWGEQDTWHPVAFGKRLVSLVPRSRLELVPNAGHNVHQERSELVNPLLIRFFGGHHRAQAEGSSMDKTQFQAVHLSRSWEQKVGAAPEKVFPLLCPVRESEWIPGWKSDVVYSVSGHAEDGAVFTTDFPERGRGTWVVYRYEPPRAVSYLIVYPDRYVERLELVLQANGKNGTRLKYIRTYTGLTAEGNRFIQHATGKSLDERMQKQMSWLEHFVSTGKMFPPATRMRHL